MFITELKQSDNLKIGPYLGNELAMMYFDKLFDSLDRLSHFKAKMPASQMEIFEVFLYCSLGSWRL